MAIFSRTFAASLLLSLVLFHLITDSHLMMEAGTKHTAPAPTVSPAPAPSPVTPEIIDCPAACSRRCKESKRPNLCKRACGSCCHRCNCVPPGAYGNYEACPCYFNLKTHNDARKCP